MLPYISSDNKKGDVFNSNMTKEMNTIRQR